MASEARAHDLAREQGALRRVAALVADGASAEHIFAAVSQEVSDLCDVPVVGVHRFEADGTFTMMGIVGETNHTVGDRRPVEEVGLATTILATGRPARLTGQAVAVPIVVEGSLWGFIAAGGKPGDALPGHTEERLARFTELVATAIANSQTREQLAKLAEEQAALRRVATTVARGSPPDEVFAQVAAEVGQLLGVEMTGIHRFEPDGSATVVTNWGEIGDVVPPDRRVRLDGDSVTARVHRTARPARIDSYQSASGPMAAGLRRIGMRGGVGSPIIVNGRLWGAIAAVTSRADPLPADAEARIAEFTELVATAIANAEARTEVQRLAEEQAALRRVATLVARGVSPAEVFSAVSNEVGRLFGSERAAVARFEPDGSAMVVVGISEGMRGVSIGTRWELEDFLASTAVHRTARPARRERSSFERAPGPIASSLREMGVVSSIASPIVVEGALWGVMTVADLRKPLPSDAEARLEKFTDLVGTALANAESRAKLAALGTRLVAAGDEARRRLARDLHDGAQQRLVHTIVLLKLARQGLRSDLDSAESLIGEATEQAEQGNAELRELAHGILPAALSRGGLHAGIEAIVARLDLPAQVDVPPERFSPEIEASAYFIVAEALTNVVKHARASHAEVRASVADDVLRVEVRDDGVGGADPHGHGLVGMSDRVTALGGRLEIKSAVTGGTIVAAVLPVASERAHRD